MGGTFFLSQPFVGHTFKVAFRRPARCQGHGEMGRGQRGSLPDWPQLIPGNTRKWFRSLQKRPPELEFPAGPDVWSGAEPVWDLGGLDRSRRWSNLPATRAPRWSGEGLETFEPPG